MPKRSAFLRTCFKRVKSGKNGAKDANYDVQMKDFSAFRQPFWVFWADTRYF